MGACIGRKSSKHLKDDRPKSESIPAPQAKSQDDRPPSQPSPSSSKTLQMADEFIVRDGDDIRLTIIDDHDVDSELEAIVNEQNIINTLLNQPFSTRVISISDTELEYELATLIYGCPEIDYTENPSVATTLKPVDV